MSVLLPDVDGVEEQAAAWLLRQSSGPLSSEDERRFQEWLAGSPAHQGAYDRAVAVWAFFAENALEPEMLTERAAALNAARSHAAVRWRGPRRRDMFWPAAAIAAGVVGVAGGAFVWSGRRPKPEIQVFTTAGGERRSVRLADGSSVSLDENSRVEVELQPDARLLRLASGQARFDVAHDAERPFHVRAGGRTITATGTAFNVDLLNATLHVLLLEGGLTVSPSTPGGDAVKMRPGDLLTATGQGKARLTSGDSDRIMAWQQGRLIFDNTPLSEAVERVNRYVTQRLVIEDPSLAGLVVSGIFKSGAGQAFVEGLTASQPVVATQRPDGLVGLRRSPT